MAESRESLANLAVRLFTIRKWLKNARERLHITRRSDIDEANASGTIIQQLEAEKPRKLVSFDETSNILYGWTCVVCVLCLYPLIFTGLFVFNEASSTISQINRYSNWIIDICFLIDLGFLTRIEYVENGVVIQSSRKMLKHRMKSKQFVLDILCILPIHLVVGSGGFLSRINRILKCYRLLDFASMTEIRTSSPYAFRVLKLVFICFVIFHWNGCLYFHISKAYDFETARIENWIFSYDKIMNPIMADCITDDPFDSKYCDADDILVPKLAENVVQSTLDEFMRVWNNKTVTVTVTNFIRQYALSFYWSALTLVTLGEQPSPCTTFQNVFEIIDTLLGLIIFAVIVGDVGNMVVAVNQRKSEFEMVVDGCKRFMTYRNCHVALKQKAIEYFAHVWKNEGSRIDEQEIADFLPSRLFGDIAVEIHIETLKKVKLFEDCDPQLLYEIILKLQFRIYSPMDYICKKGEVGTEMYIVKEGQVEVVSEDGSKIFVTLGAGVVFGELSILNIPGNKNKNLRTASVRSKGYSDLYVLDKEDLWEALREYPAAKDSLIKKGEQILAKDNLLQEDSINDEIDDTFSSVDEQIQKLANQTMTIVEQLTEAEGKFKDFQTKMKSRLYTAEIETIQLIKNVN